MATRPPGPGGSGKWFDRADMAERELNFADADDDRLPWLESDDEDEDSAAIDTGRLVGIGLLMIVALVLVVGGVWYVTNRMGNAGAEPDGSLIAAPATPYKERPDDPGGKTFPGTGDTSYAVGEGQTVEARLATASPPPVASVPQPTASASPTTAASEAAPADEGLPAGTVVQVGAYSSRSDAEAGWATLMRRTELLAGVSHRIVRGRADIGTVYRLQAAGGDRASAHSLCERLKAAGVACQIK